jgi:hypothetical protein
MMSQKSRDNQRTGYPLRVNDEPPIGSAEIRESEDESSEFSLPVGYDDPTRYRGKTPQPDCIIGVVRT